MKRILSCLLCLVFLSLAACRAQQEPPPESKTSSDTIHTESPEPKDFSLPFQVENGAIVLGGLSWGMAKGDILSALGISPEDMPDTDSELTALIPGRQAGSVPGQSSSGTLSYLKDPSLLAGGDARTVTFSFQDCSYFSAGDPTPRLCQIRVFFPYGGPQDLEDLSEEVRVSCGDPAPERLTVRTDAPPSGVSGPPWIQKTEIKGPEQVLWYSPGTWNSALTPGADDWMRHNTMGAASLSGALSKEESTEIWQEDANWAMKTQKTFLTELTLDASMENEFNRGDIPGLEGGPFLVVTLQGQNACYAGLINRQYPE